MLSKLSYIFTVLFTGIFFAVLFYPLAHRIESFLLKNSSILKKYEKANRILSVTSCYLFFVLLVLIVFYLFYRNLYDYFCNVSVEEFQVKIEKLMYQFQFIFVEKCPDILYDAITNGVGSYVKYLWNFLLDIPKILAKFAIAVVISIYLLLDRDNYLLAIERLNKDYISDKYRKLLHEIVFTSKKIFTGYWKGQFFDAIYMGIVLSVGFYIIGVPLGISIGILSGIGNLVPYVGPVLGFFLGTFFCLVEGKIKVWIIAMIYLIIAQQIDASIVGPKLLGRETNLRPLSVVVAVMIGGTLFGAFGMIFAVPVAGILKSAFLILKRKQAS